MHSPIPVRKENVIEKELPDEFILVNADTNELTAPSSAGQAIWELIDGRRSVDKIIAQICSDHDVRPDDSIADEEAPDAVGEVLYAQGDSVADVVREFIDILNEKGLIALEEPT